MIHAPPSHKCGENKQYTACDIKRADCARQFHNINGQSVNRIIHLVDNIILQNIPILREYVGMYEDIYGTFMTYLQVRTVLHKIQHVEYILVPNSPKVILDKYKKVIL